MFSTLVSAAAVLLGSSIVAAIDLDIDDPSRSLRGRTGTLC